MVNIPKIKRTFCKCCGRHTSHKVTQYKMGKRRNTALGQRGYVEKQKGYGGQTLPIFRKKAKTTKKPVLKLQCSVCKKYSQHCLKRTKHIELGGEKKKRGQVDFMD